MKPRELQRWINRQRVLLAIYASLRDDSPCTNIRNTRLGREAGIGEAAVKRALADLEEAGTIKVVPPSDRCVTNLRGIVPMDDPNAENFLAFARFVGLGCGYDPDWWRSREFRAEVKAAGLLPMLRQAAQAV